MFKFDPSCICVFVYLYLGNEEVVVGEWVVDVISFQKIFGLCGLECHIVEIFRDVTLVDDGQRTTEHEDRARTLETEFAMTENQMKISSCLLYLFFTFVIFGTM